MTKFSKQRESILNNLKMRRDHPTADMVYSSLKAEHPNISLGTVYRNLSMLAEAGHILKISTGTGPDRFDGFTRPHNHFVCKCCGRVLDMDYIPEERIVENASKGFSGKIEEYVLNFYGKCDRCESIDSVS